MTDIIPRLLNMAKKAVHQASRQDRDYLNFLRAKYTELYAGDPRVIEPLMDEAAKMIEQQTYTLHVIEGELGNFLRSDNWKNGYFNLEHARRLREKVNELYRNIDRSTQRSEALFRTVIVFNALVNVTGGEETVTLERWF